VHETAPMHDRPDTWHDHSHDESPQHAHGEVQNSRLVMGVGLALTAVIVASVLVVYGFYVHYNTHRSDQRERTDTAESSGSPILQMRVFKAKQLAELEGGSTFEMPTEAENVKKTVVMGPIKAAMDTVAERYTKPAAK
jgi:hypothetical protein